MNVDKFVNNRVLEKFSSIINLVTMKKNTMPYVKLIKEDINFIEILLYLGQDDGLNQKF